MREKLGEILSFIERVMSKKTREAFQKVMQGNKDNKGAQRRFTGESQLRLLPRKSLVVQKGVKSRVKSRRADFLYNYMFYIVLK